MAEITDAVHAGLPALDWLAAADSLRNDGVVMLPGVFNTQALAKLESAFDGSMAKPTDNAVHFYPRDNALFFQDTGQNYLPVLKEMGLHKIVAALWGSRRMWYMGEQLFLKQGGHSRRTPWHQDTSYLRMRGRQMVACWITLDELPQQHCLEFIPGTHLGPLYNGSAFSAADDTAPLYADSPLPRLPDIQAHRDNYDIRSWHLQPGDLVVFHLGVLHGGGATEPNMRRRTASLRFMGDDVVYDDRVRDRRGSRAGNDTALAELYAKLTDGQPFHEAGMYQTI